MTTEAADLWGRAQRALRTADALCADDPDAAASRAYYAAFYAVSALFALEGQAFRKHTAVAAAVHRDLVKTGRCPAEVGMAYAAMLQHRATGDYGGSIHVTTEAAHDAVSKARRIIDAVARLRPNFLPRHEGYAAHLRHSPDRARLVNWSDLVFLAALGVVIYLGVRVGGAAPRSIPGHEIALTPTALPLYAALSLGRMSAAYVLSVVFSLVYGGLAARNKVLEKLLLPGLDVLQSVPILSFLPVVLLSLSTVLPQRVAAELASVVLIFTSQAWNMTFSWYQSLTTIPRELHEAGAILLFNRRLRFTTLLLPFGLIGLIWNSMMGWAGGWFFLMAAEMFAVGERNFRLPGLGAYLQEAANQGDAAGLVWGIGTLVLVIVVLDQLVWRPLLAWSDRFKVESVEGELPPTSWFLDILQSSRLLSWVRGQIVPRLARAFDGLRAAPQSIPLVPPRSGSRERNRWATIGLTVVALALAYALYRAAAFLTAVTLAEWGHLLLAVSCTLLRVAAALALSLLWTLPVGVAIGTNRRLAAWLQPVVQIAASLPATALFPVLLLVLLHLPGGLNFGAVLLMLMGTQWYLLFNIIAGASAIPQDLKYTAAALQLSRFERWRTLILPTLFPYLVTGAIAASGGAWNASIVAEYAQFGGRTVFTLGIGATIASATAEGHYHVLYAATLTMILTVVAVNRFVWRRLFRVAETRYRLD